MRIVLLVSLLLVSCSEVVDTPDASVDSGTSAPDSGVVDAGFIDAGEPDAGGIEMKQQFVFTGGGATIRVYAFEDAGLRLLSSVNGGSGSSFIAPDLWRGRVYAVNEGSGQIAAFSFTFDESDAGLTLINRVSSGGNGPAHLSVDQSGRYVFAANYSAGSVAVIPVTDAGLAAPTQTLNQLGQAHQIFSDANNRFVYAPCKAADFIAQYSFDAGVLTPLSPPTLATANGAGPRHLALHPTLPRAYLINELSSTVQTLAIDAQGRLTTVQTLSSLPSGFNAANTGAEIAVHPNGRFVFASNRGHDSIVRFAVDATSGELTLLGHTSTEGSSPRHFSLDANGKWLLVGNQQSGNVVLFELDDATGALTSRGVVAEVAGVAYAGFVTAP